MKMHVHFFLSVRASFEGWSSTGPKMDGDTGRWTWALGPGTLGGATRIDTSPGFPLGFRAWKTRMWPSRTVGAGLPPDLRSETAG